LMTVNRRDDGDPQLSVKEKAQAGSLKFAFVSHAFP
jgi:hypothetical protein